MKYQKLEQDVKDNLREAVLLLRYHDLNPTLKSFKYLSYTSITKLVGLRYGTV